MPNAQSVKTQRIIKGAEDFQQEKTRIALNTETYNRQKEKLTDLFLKLSTEKLNQQSAHWDALDQKNAITIAAYGIILTALVALDLTQISMISKWFAAVILVAWIATIFCGIVCSLLSLRLKEINMPPDILSLIEKYSEKGERITKLHLLNRMAKAINQNKITLDNKAELLSLSIRYFLPISLGILFIAIVLKSFSFGG